MFMDGPTISARIPFVERTDSPDPVRYWPATGPRGRDDPHMGRLADPVAGVTFRPPTIDTAITEFAGPRRAGRYVKHPRRRHPPVRTPRRQDRATRTDRRNAHGPTVDQSLGTRVTAFARASGLQRP